MSGSPYFADAPAVPRPLPNGSDAAYHEALLQHRLVVPRCDRCGTWSWPPDVICYRCRSFDQSWTETDPVGRIYSWTRVWHPARPELAREVPYVVVLVELPAADGVRLVGNLLGPGDQDVACGMPVRGVFEDAPDGSYALLQWQRH